MPASYRLLHSTAHIPFSTVIASIPSIAFIAFTTVVAACGSSAPPAAGADAASSAPTHETATATSDEVAPEVPSGSCDAIIIVPPIVTVLRASGSADACDATFKVTAESDAAAVTPSSAAVDCHGSVPYGGCPTAPTDSATPPCQYALVGLTPGIPCTVEVSEPGFEPVVVHDVVAGMGGCAPATPSTQATVTLVAKSDDAGSD